MEHCLSSVFSPAGIRRIILLMIVSAHLSPAQDNSIRVQLEGSTQPSTSIGIFRRNGTVYGSLTDLAALFSLSTYANPATQKFEIKQPPYRIKVTAGNPFIVVTAQSNRQSVYQLNETVIYAAHSYFVPLNSFVPLFDVVFGRSATFDREAGILRISSIPATPAFDISTLRFEEKTNGMLIRIPVARPLNDFESWLKQDGWLYVTIADARADVDAINRIRPEGIVKKIVAIQSPTSVQLTFKLSGNIAAAEILRGDRGNDILVSIRNEGNEKKLLLEAKRKEIQQGLESQRKRWKLDVIVIDPGHGGRDPGSIGVTGVREKDITLGIGLKLGRLISKRMNGVKVVYTRKDDSWVELYRRGQIANEADGKLFISIHANSLRRKPNPTRGFEVYLLRPGRTAEAIEIAERENSVIELEEGYEERYQALTDENFILVTMAQSAHVKASELFADITQQEIAARAGIPNRGVKQAGFLVLVGASMPNVLVETAYLSNREDERFLKSEQGQQKIAEALFHAVQRYKNEYEKLLEEGKSLGEASTSSR
jgi:N-acetylmuramoyl-L-alanine amidase